MKVASLEPKSFIYCSIVSFMAKVVFLPFPESNGILVKISKSYRKLLICSDKTFSTVFAMALRIEKSQIVTFVKFVTLHKNSFHMSNFKQSGKHELRDMKSMRRTQIAKSVFFNSFSRNIIMPDGFLCVHLFHVRYFLMCINFIKGKKWLNFI